MLKAAEDSDDDQKQRIFIAGSSNDDQTMAALAQWVGKAKSQRYFMVHVHANNPPVEVIHTMGAVGSSGGELRFFDPNAGIVSTKKPEKMDSFLTSYFDQPVIKQAYKGVAGARSPGKVRLSVCKYKA